MSEGAQGNDEAQVTRSDEEVEDPGDGRGFPIVPATAEGGDVPLRDGGSIPDDFQPAEMEGATPPLPASNRPGATPGEIKMHAKQQAEREAAERAREGDGT